LESRELTITNLSITNYEFTYKPEEEESLVFIGKECWDFGTSSGSLGGAGELELLHVPFGYSIL